MGDTSAGVDLMRLYVEMISRKDLQDYYGCALHLQRMAVEIERLEAENKGKDIAFQAALAGLHEKNATIAKQAKVIEEVKSYCEKRGAISATDSCSIILSIINAEGK